MQVSMNIWDLIVKHMGDVITKFPHNLDEEAIVEVFDHEKDEYIQPSDLKHLSIIVKRNECEHLEEK